MAKRGTIPTKLESKFQREFKGKLDALPNSYFFVKEAAALRGIPDIIGCCNGLFVALELKRSAAEARKKTGRIVLQKHIIGKMSRANGYALIVHPENADEVLEFLTEQAHKKL
jgi:hypothetical protein